MCGYAKPDSDPVLPQEHHLSQAALNPCQGSAEPAVLCFVFLYFPVGVGDPEATRRRPGAAHLCHIFIREPS